MMHLVGYLPALAIILALGRCMEAYVPTVVVSRRQGRISNRIPGRIGFIATTTTTTTKQQQQEQEQEQRNYSWLLFANGKEYDNDNDNEEDDDDREGMENAFRSLDALSSLDFGEDITPTDTPTNTDSEEGFSKSMKELENLLQASDLEPAKLESEEEMKLYADMYTELQTDGDSKMYNDIMENMATTSSKKMTIEEAVTAEENVYDDADGIGMATDDDDDGEQLTTMMVGGELSQDSKDFMEQAVKEALAEAKTMGAPVSSNDPNSIFKDEEMMKELNDIFDKANEQLLASIAEMKEEQDALSKASANKRSERSSEQEKRLAEAESSVSRLVDTVKKETQEVEKALADLQAAQGQLNEDPLMKAADLKAAGIVKQGALVGMFLFTTRALGDLVAIGGVDGSSHATAALIQGAIALFCAAYFFFF